MFSKQELEIIKEALKYRAKKKEKSIMYRIDAMERQALLEDANNLKILVEKTDELIKQN